MQQHPSRILDRGHVGSCACPVAVLDSHPCGSRLQSESAGSAQLSALPRSCVGGLRVTSGAMMSSMCTVSACFFFVRMNGLSSRGFDCASLIGLLPLGNEQRKMDEHYKFIPFSLGPRTCPGYSMAKVPPPANKAMTKVCSLFL